MSRGSCSIFYIHVYVSSVLLNLELLFNCSIFLIRATLKVLWVTQIIPHNQLFWTSSQSPPGEFLFPGFFGIFISLWAPLGQFPTFWFRTYLWVCCPYSGPRKSFLYFKLGLGPPISTGGFPLAGGGVFLYLF